ncbi:MAG: o-succinylbenzoate synthase [Gemmatimonadetes bacterium]|nr:o-succinylbenzoate synthase [Gemmatimonadota bacterium]
MKIDRVVLREIRMQLKEPFEISSGVCYDRRVTLLTLYADGLSGWSECVAGEDPGYSYETCETAWTILTQLILPQILGKEVTSTQKSMKETDWIKGHPMAKAALEMALMDLEAKAQNKPLSSLLGGTKQEVAVGVSVGLQPTNEELARKVGTFIEKGYSRIKLKIKPGRDVHMVASIRERYPNTQIMVDANSAYTLQDMEVLKELDKLDLMMIEQPLAYDDYLDHSRLQQELQTPICLDESIRSVRDAKLALELGSCQIINIKPGRVGGIASSKAIHDICLEANIPVWCGGMLESGVGRAHNVALASLPGFVLPGDISESQRYWAEDIVEPEFTMDNGHVQVPTGQGIGVAVLEDLVTKLTVETAVF